MENAFSLIGLHNQMLAQQAAAEILACNEVSRRYGLQLTDAEARELVEYRAAALKNTGRVEFSGGVLPRLIRAFCDSPYLDPENYESTLIDLQEAFYYFKSESQDRFTDDELIEYMAKVFNGRAQGSAEYLIGTSLEALCRYANRDDDPQSADEAGDWF